MWNYRIIAHDEVEWPASKINPELEEVYLEIVEMYYDKNKIPNGYPATSKSLGGDSIKNLNWSLNKMKLALKKPIISIKNFPNEYKPNENK